MRDPTSEPGSRRRAARPRPAWGFGAELYAAFAGVVCAFLLSTAYAQYSEASIDRAARDIAAIASPSIEHLASARSGLRRYARDVDDLVAAVHGAPRREELARSRALLGEALAAYRAIPFFQGEQRLWGDLERQLAEVDALVARLLAAVDEGRRDEIGPLRRELVGAVDRTGDRIGVLVGFNAAEAHRLALEIERLHGRSRSVEIVLDAACVLGAVLAAIAIHRAARSRAALAEAHTRLVEARGEELELFASRVAHDVLGPLGSTRLAIDAALRRVEDERARSQLGRGRAGVDRTVRIVHDLLDFARAGARAEAGAACDLAAVLDEVLGEVAPEAEAAGAQVDRVVDAGLPPVACGAGVLACVASNLVRNAVKHLGDRPVRRVIVRASAGAGRVVLEVEDTGPGLPEGLGDRVFEPYVRGPGAPAAGLGLGLATVKKLVDAHGGHVGVRSSPGDGALFRVELPAARGPARPRSSPPSAPPAAAAG